ncbi:MAG TPA: lipoprotein-releasing ABC transporter permease subunit [Tabrizicola sp.]|nr:lipoprotein-releasing ABC transporter permease subunit [Tabrizicola sp.]
MASKTAPFSGYEFMIAWRYLRARRAEGGVSVMTWISVIGITLAVFALIATMAVRAGFRAEFVNTILGANAHVSVYSLGEIGPEGQSLRGFGGYEDLAEALAAVPGVTTAAPVTRAQVMVSTGERNSGAEVFGIAAEDFAAIPAMVSGGDDLGDIGLFPEGVALGSGVARELGVTIGDRVRMISPNGVKTAMGTSPRHNTYTVTYIFTTGSPDIDRVRAYLPLAEAQSFFNMEGRVDEFQVSVANPEEIDSYAEALAQAGGPSAMLWSWKDSSGNFLRALTVEDNMMFILMSILVLIAAMNIISGLVMLVKNKGRDIGILRTMGLTEGAVLRIFFLCGAFTGIAGTLLGILTGCLFAIYFTPIFDFINWAAGGGVWDPTVRPIYHLSAKLQAGDVLSAALLSLGLSFVITLVPARRAARMNPVEALRYE